MKKRSHIAFELFRGASCSLQSCLMLVLVSFSIFLPAQQSNTLFLMHDVAQSNTLNPAVQLKCKWMIGLPALGTAHVNYSNSSFTYNDLARNGVLDLNYVYDNLHRMNTISLEAQAYPVMVGYRRGINYYTFSIADRFTGYASYSENLAGMLLYGNAQFVGDPVRIHNTRVNALYYREYSAGWSVEWDRFTTFGLRGKLLFGKAGLQTGASRVRFQTDTETFDLDLRGAVSLSSSFPMTVVTNNAGLISDLEIPAPDYVSLLMNPRNVGLAVDYGVIHKYNKDLTLSASILDFGMIFWTDDLNNVKAAVDFMYEGVQEGVDFSAAAYFRDLSDSVMNNILYEVTQKPYFSPLPLQVILGADYQWTKQIKIGFVNRNVLVNRRLISSFTAVAHASLLDQLSLSFSWSYYNNSIRNIGAGLAYTGRGVQMYVVSDHVAGLILPMDTRSLNLRMGINLMLGCPKDPREARLDPRYMLIGKCDWIERERRVKRRR